MSRVAPIPRDRLLAGIRLLLSELGDDAPHRGLFESLDRFHDRLLDAWIERKAS